MITGIQRLKRFLNTAILQSGIRRGRSERISNDSVGLLVNGCTRSQLKLIKTL